MRPLSEGDFPACRFGSQNCKWSLWQLEISRTNYAIGGINQNAPGSFWFFHTWKAANVSAPGSSTLRLPAKIKTRPAHFDSGTGFFIVPAVWAFCQDRAFRQQRQHGSLSWFLPPVRCILRSGSWYYVKKKYKLKVNFSYNRNFQTSFTSIHIESSFRR